MAEKPKTKVCRECGKEFPIEELSRKQLCRDCGIARQVAVQDHMRELSRQHGRLQEK